MWSKSSGHFEDEQGTPMCGGLGPVVTASKGRVVPCSLCHTELRLQRKERRRQEAAQQEINTILAKRMAKANARANRRSTSAHHQPARPPR